MSVWGTTADYLTPTGLLMEGVYTQNDVPGLKLVIALTATQPS